MHDNGDSSGNGTSLLLLDPRTVVITIAATIAGVQGILFFSLEVEISEGV